MLTRIDRYIAVHVLSAIAVVMLVIVGLMGLSLFLDELGEVNRFYTMNDAIRYVLLSLPSLAYQLLPLSALVGTLVGMGILASSSELTVMRASGLSMTRLIVAVSKPILGLALVALLVSQTGVPEAQQAARSAKAIAKTQSGQVQTSEGGWYKQGSEYILVSAISSKGEIFGITRYQFDDELRLVENTYAQKGQFIEGEKGWMLSNLSGTKQVDDEIKAVKLDSQFWDSDLTPDMLTVILIPPIDLPISDLRAYASYLSNQGVDAAPYQLAFWSKLLQPFSIIALVMIGTAFVFGPLRGVTIGQRIVSGVVVGLVFKFSQDLLAPASQVLGFSPLLAAMTPILISFAIAIGLLARVR